MRPRASKDAALWYKSDMKSFVVGALPVPRRIPLWKTRLRQKLKILYSATVCMSMPSFSVGVSTTPSLLKISAPPNIEMEDRLLIISLSHASSCVLPRFTEQHSVPNCGQNLPNQFRFVFCCCKLLVFLYIEVRQGRLYFQNSSPRASGTSAVCCAFLVVRAPGRAL